MAVSVRIPTTLRPLTGGASEVQVEAGTVAEALSALEISHPGFGDRILDESGQLRRFVNVFVSDDDIRFLDGLDTGGARRGDGGHRSRGSRRPPLSSPSLSG